MKLRKALAFIIFLGLSASTSSQVLYGQQASHDSMNYLVRVQLKFDNDIQTDQDIFGGIDAFGGTIISERFILTVANPFRSRPSRVVVKAGVKNYRDAGQVRETDMDHVHPHPLYQPNGDGNGFDASYDVALIHLAGIWGKLYLGVNYRATKADLPVGLYREVIELPLGFTCKITGWGSTQRGYPHAHHGYPDHAMEAKVQLRDDQECLNARNFQSYPAQTKSFPFYRRNKHLCYEGALRLVGRPSAGLGDEGGPVSCKVLQDGQLAEFVFAVHLFSRNNDVSEPDRLNVGVKLDKEKIDWINETMRRNDFYLNLVHRVSNFRIKINDFYENLVHRVSSISLENVVDRVNYYGQYLFGFMIWLAFVVGIFYGLNRFIRSIVYNETLSLGYKPHPDPRVFGQGYEPLQEY